MKEIQGKIKFGVIKLTHKPIGDVDCVQCPKELFEQYVLSQITEEQAAEFVEYYNSERVYRNYIGFLDEAWDCPTAKESLISLLKTNDVWIKEWTDMPKYEDYVNKAYCYDFIPDKYKYNKLPDDLLLIKLQ